MMLSAKKILSPVSLSFYIPIFLLFLGFITYLPSLKAQLFWDDDDFIVNNQYVKEFRIDKFFTAQAVEGAGKISNYYRPVQFTIYSVVYNFAGPNAFIFHLVSITAHITATIALYFFLSNLFHLFKHATHQSSSFQIPVFCFLISILFLIHPVQTEAVTYVSGLSDPLVALFGFLSLYFFITSLPKREVSLRTTKQSHTSILLSIFCFLLTLLSKESGIIFLGIIMLIICFKQILSISSINQQPTTDNRQLITLLPFSLITLLYLFIHRRFIDVIDMAAVYGDSPYTHSVIVRLSTFLSLIPQYISLLFFPKTLFYDRDFTIKILTSVWHLPSIIVLFILVTISIILFLNIRYTKYSQPTTYNLQLITNYLLFFSFLCFFITFIPFSGLTLINGIMYEHFVYLALPFFFLFILLLLYRFVFQFLHLSISSRVICFLFAVCCFLLIVRSWSRQYEWQSPIPFYLQTLRYAPNSFRILNNLGLSYGASGDTNLAIQTFQRAIALNPALPNPYHNIGEIYLKEKKYDKAEEQFLSAIAVDPNFGYSYSSLVALYQQTGEKEKLLHVTEEITKKFQR